MYDRKLINVLKLCENYQTDGINYAWLGRKTSTQKQKELLMVKVPYPDIDWCIRTKTYISYDPVKNQLFISDSLKYGKNHWISTFVDDVKNKRIDISNYYIV